MYLIQSAESGISDPMYDDAMRSPSPIVTEPAARGRVVKNGRSLDLLCAEYRAIADAADVDR